VSLRDLLLASLVMLIWGINFAVSKLGVAEIPPLLFMAFRFACVALIIAPFMQPKRHQLPGILLLSVTLGVGHFGLMFLGLANMDAATAAIVIQLQVPFSAALAAFFFKEKLGWLRGAGIAVAFSGVALLSGEPTLPGWLPLLWVIGSGLAFALANVVVKRIGDVNPVLLNGWMALMAAPMLLLLSLIFESNHLEALQNARFMGWFAIVYTAIGASIIAYSLWYWLVRRYEMNQIVPFSLLAPAIGVLAGVVILGETFTWHKAVGGLLTLLGVSLIQFAPMLRRRG
jgi:O-acetylserine/cysteine efflux transporter